MKTENWPHFFKFFVGMEKISNILCIFQKVTQERPMQSQRPQRPSQERESTAEGDVNLQVGGSGAIKGILNWISQAISGNKTNGETRQNGSSSVDLNSNGALNLNGKFRIDRKPQQGQSKAESNKA